MPETPDDITIITNSRSQTVFVSWTPPTATDNSGEEVTITSSHKPGDSFPIGMSTVIYTATDAYGNEANVSFVVIVEAIGKSMYRYFKRNWQKSCVCHP